MHRELSVTTLLSFLAYEKSRNDGVSISRHALASGLILSVRNRGLAPNGW